MFHSHNISIQVKSLNESTNSPSYGDVVSIHFSTSLPSEVKNPLLCTLRLSSIVHTEYVNMYTYNVTPCDVNSRPIAVLHPACEILERLCWRVSVCSRPCASVRESEAGFHVTSVYSHGDRHQRRHRPPIPSCTARISQKLVGGGGLLSITVVPPDWLSDSNNTNRKL